MNSVMQTEGLAAEASEQGVRGEFVDLEGERFYAIRDVDRMPPFFISVISHDDHWLFASSTGGLTAGRISPETALFPYSVVDKIHESTPHTGSLTLLRVLGEDTEAVWDPFDRLRDGAEVVSRHLYKNVLGNKLCFEATHHGLGLRFRYTWVFSAEHGFVRQCRLDNLSEKPRQVALLDGLQNLLPAGTPLRSQTETSNLVNAYKWNELDPETGLAYLTLYAQISDRAEPRESLKATTVYCLGLEGRQVLLSSRQVEAFRRGESVQQETLVRGVRGAYLVHHQVSLGAGEGLGWRIVADVEQSQSAAVQLRRQLLQPDAVDAEITRAVDDGCEELARLMASTDGFQATAEETVSVHHYANVLFNVLRGGLFVNGDRIPASDFRATLGHFNRVVVERHAEWLEGLPAWLSVGCLLRSADGRDDPQLSRLSLEYLPITFGRRHGDPSRPWNKFAIRIKDGAGRRLFYEGNWRDIFQNWEALTFSFPSFIEGVVAKFVNASTVDGYNPYRITKDGIDWEIEDPDDPWSYIGYWGDHQIIYLLKLLEQSRQFHPDRLRRLLRRPIFCYANVPYRIVGFDDLLADPKNTVRFDETVASTIDQRVASLGADGKLVLDAAGEVQQVNLMEKLLVPLLSKLGNLVVDGGIWLNTQRPEWNDANNALVGHGLSMVTLGYLRRYLRFLDDLLADEATPFPVSAEVATWLTETARSLAALRDRLEHGPLDEAARFAALAELGRAADAYRRAVYAQGHLSAPVETAPETIRSLLADAIAVVDASLRSNRREDGLFHAYNLMNRRGEQVAVEHLYTMLEGQVSALSAGTLDPGEAAALVDALFDSDVYRPDQHSFMLYPDRSLPGFLSKNRIATSDLEAIPLLEALRAEGDESIVVTDPDGVHRFHADLVQIGDLDERLEELARTRASVETSRAAVRALYEQVFNHRAFTGRSGTMFGFEGLGSIYWHMVSKLLLAVQENFFRALEAADLDACRQLGEQYYRIRQGLGFNKTPSEYGAFPTDPYSHTPAHAGARQPGMTGQVKEEVLTRFAELGIRVKDGQVHLRPALLRSREFVEHSAELRFLDVDGHWQALAVPERSLAFTWCQVPVVYRLREAADPTLTVHLDDGTDQQRDVLALSLEESGEIFRRSGRVRRLSVDLPTECLFGD